MELNIGDKVITKHGTVGTIIAIYENTKYPYVVRIYRNGRPYGSDYKKTDLTIMN